MIFSIPPLPLLDVRAGSDLQHFENRAGRTSWLSGRWPWVLGAATLSSGAYYWSCMETVPYTGRRHSIMFVSRTQELALGRTVFEMVRVYRSWGGC